VRARSELQLRSFPAPERAPRGVFISALPLPYCHRSLDVLPHLSVSRAPLFSCLLLYHDHRRCLRTVAAAGCGMLLILKSKQAHAQQKSTKRLHIRLKRGEDLIAADSGGTSDPYVIFKIGYIKVKSSTQHKTVNPVWNDEFDVGVIDLLGKIDIKVYDKDLLHDDALGHAVFELLSVPKDHPLELSLNLTNKKQQGFLHLDVWLTDSASSAEAVAGETSFADAAAEPNITVISMNNHSTTVLVSEPASPAPAAAETAPAYPPAQAYQPPAYPPAQGYAQAPAYPPPAYPPAQAYQPPAYPPAQGYAPASPYARHRDTGRPAPRRTHLRLPTILRRNEAPSRWRLRTLVQASRSVIVTRLSDSGCCTTTTA